MKFDDIVIGEANRFAVEAAGLLCNGKAPFANPLTIIGPTGAGKTCILKAIADSFAENGKSVEATTGVDLLDGYVEALRTSDIRGFRSKIRDCDVLVVDSADCMFSSERVIFRQEFERCLVERLARDQVTVVAIRQTIGALFGGDEGCVALKGRMESGVVCEISSPDRSMCVEILRREALKHDEELSVPQLQALVDVCRGDIWSSLGALRRSVCVRKLGRLDIKRMPIMKIIDVTARYYGLAPDDLVGRLEPGPIRNAAYVAMFIVREFTAWRCDETAAAFGKPTATILYASKRGREMYEFDQKVKTDVDRILERLK